MKMLFFDTETTGLRPGSICQLSYITVDTSTKPYKINSKNVFFKVDYVEPSAENIHGFGVDLLERLSEGLSFSERYHEFLEDFLYSDIVIGHNVPFDIKFIEKEFNDCGISYKPKNIMCTMRYYKDVCKLIGRGSDYKNPKLCEVTEFLQLKNNYIEDTANKLFNGSGDFHDARFDTAATYLIVVEGIKKGYIPPKYISNLVKASSKNK